MHFVIFAVIFAGIGGYVIFRSFAATVDCANYPTAPSGTASINLCPTTVDHTLPNKFWGYGFSPYRYQDVTQTSYRQLFSKTNAEVFRWSEAFGSRNPGTPASPDIAEQDILSFFKAEQALGVNLGVSLQFNSGPAVLPTTDPPADINNVPMDNRSPSNHANMVNWFMDNGIDVLAYAAYNEPDNNQDWYSGTTQTILNEREAWAYVHQRQYADAIHQALSVKGRTVKILGGVLGTGEGYGTSWAQSFFSGSGTIISDGGGWPWTTNNLASTSYGPIFDIYDFHPYPANGDNQSGLNSLLYPTLTTNYQSGLTAFMETERNYLNSNGGSNKQLGFDEGGYDLNTNEDALVEGEYAVILAREQSRWNVPFYTLWAANADTAAGTGNYPLFLTSDGVNFRDTIRSSAARDIVGKFLHNYKKQITGHSTSMVTGSGMTPGGNRSNSVPRIQASAGLSSDGSKMGVLAVNLDMSNSQPFQLNMGTTPAGPISETYMLESTPVGNMPTSSISTSSNNFTVTMQPGAEYLFEIPISSSTSPTVYLNANPTSITAGTSSTLTWNSTNATSCSATSPGGWTNQTVTSGSVSVSPTTTTTYTITCTSAGGSTSATTTVTVKAAPLSVPATSVNHIIDGNLSESDWKINNNITKLVSGSTPDTGSWGALWNNNYLYIGVKVSDSTLSTNPANDPGSYWQNDSVEVYVDPNGDGGTTYDANDKQLAQGYNDPGLFGVSSSTPGVLHAWAPVTGGYSVEMAIPWSSLGVTPSSGMNLALDIGINDSVNGSRVGQLIWNGTANDWQDPAGFGPSSLSGTPTTAVPGDVNGDGLVNAMDLSILLSHYGTTSTTGDLNGDGLVNASDLSILLSHYG